MLKGDFSNLKSKDVVAVALSGGADSTALLYLLLEESKKLGVTVKAVSVEHGIRGESSKNDLAFCIETCKKLGVEIRTVSVDAPLFAKENGYSLEQAARILRYNAFFAAIDEHFCDKIAVAHHLNDRAETIFFNIFRGASLKGAGGMTSSGYDGKIVRPLLNAAKNDILAYLRDKNLSFVQDETNFDDNYTRNALRLNVCPEIKKVFPNFESAVVRFGESCASDDEYLYSLAKERLKENDGVYEIDQTLPYPLFSRAAILSLKALGVTKDYQKQHVDDIFALTFNQSGKEVDLPKNVVATKIRDKVLIYKKTADNRLIAPYIFGDVAFGNVVLRIEKVSLSDVKFGDGLYFDADKIPSGCVFRRRETGDVFTKFNGQTVSLKKFLTDKKLSLPEKRQAIVLAKENIVYLIADLEISSLIKIDKRTENVVKLKSSSTKE